MLGLIQCVSIQCLGFYQIIFLLTGKFTVFVLSDLIKAALRMTGSIRL